MIYKHLFLTAILFLGTFVNGHTGNYTKSGNTVTVNVESPGERGAKTVRLQVIGDKIVRVEATPETSFPEKQSLIVVPQKANTRFTVTQQGDDITVSTRQVRAVVSSRTGHVAFYDADGRLLLGETARDGKTFRPFTVPERETGTGTLTDGQRNGWTWHMQFDSPADEAFYGLGEHQAE